MEKDELVRDAVDIKKMHGYFWAARKKEPCKICKREGREGIGKENY